MAYRVLLCGVGGQGTILAAHVLAEAALASGMDVKVSEIHGMAQRGGSVTTVVTFGNDVTSMVSGIGSVDALVSFELLEALRNIDQLKEGGRILVSDEVIKPASVLTGKADLPSNADVDLCEMGALIIPAQACAREAGNAKASNIAMLGALSGILDFDYSVWEDAIKSHVPEKFFEVNVEAFKAGRLFLEEHEAKNG